MTCKRWLGAFALALVAATSAQASPFPKLDVTKTCGQNIELSGKADPKAYQSCMKDEDSYRDKAEASWNKVSVADRTTCADLSGMVWPDYVELSVCLDMYRPDFGIQRPAPAAKAAPLSPH